MVFGPLQTLQANVLLLQLVFKLLPVSALPLFFYLKRAFFIWIDPEIIVGEIQYTPSRYSVPSAEVDIFPDAVSDTVNVLPMRITEFLPHCWFKTVPQSLFSLLRPSSHCVGHNWLALHKGFIHRQDENKVFHHVSTSSSCLPVFRFTYTLWVFAQCRETHFLHVKLPASSRAGLFLRSAPLLTPSPAPRPQ